MIDFLYELTPEVQALIAGMFTFIITSFGAASVFLFKKFNKTLLNGFLSISAGVMIAATFFSLINPAIDMANNLGLIPPNIWHPTDSVNAGNKVLAEFIKKAKPKYYFCGHIHDSNHQITEIDGTTMANVSLLNDSYKMVYEPLYLDI